MERQVFISYAAGDPDWTAERVAELAARLDALQLQVHLDVRHQQSFGQKVPPAGWREWMSRSMATATHVVCLCSERYAQAWQRNESLSGGCGVAFESTRIERYLYDHKQNNHGRVLAVVLGASMSKFVPEPLSDPCPTYVWGDEAEDALLQSHLCGVAVTVSPFGLEIDLETCHSSENVARPSVSQAVDAKLRHQVEDAVERIEGCPSLWAALSGSVDMKHCLGEQSLRTPRSMVDSLMALDVATLRTVLVLVRRIHIKVSRNEVDSTMRAQMAQVTVAMYLICICLQIRVDSVVHLSGLHKLGSDDAAKLFASLIATVMMGGRLVLMGHADREMPVPERFYAVQLLGMPTTGSGGKSRPENSSTPTDEFERRLYSAVMESESAPQAALKSGKLSPQERADLIARLEDLRGVLSEKYAMGVVIFAPDSPGDIGTALVSRYDIPVFSIHKEITYRLLGDLSPHDLIAQVGELWRVVGGDIEAVRQEKIARPNSMQVALDEFQRTLRGYLEANPDHPDAAKILVVLEELERADKSETPPRREILVRTKETIENLNDIAEAGEKFIPRLIDLFAQISRFWPF